MIDVPVRVRDALKSGMTLKNHRFIVYDNDTRLFIIDNDTLVDNSVSYDERLCSGDKLKFGLCEGSSLQFQYFDHPSILGKRIKAEISVQYEDKDKTLKWYTIPMGYFDVVECPMQFATGIHKVTAYNKLRSAFLDADCKNEIAEIVADGESGIPNSSSIDNILYKLLKGYAVEPNFVSCDFTYGNVVRSNNPGLVTTTGKYLYTDFIGAELRIDGVDPKEYYRISIKPHKLYEKWFAASSPYHHETVYATNRPANKMNFLEFMKTQDFVAKDLDFSFQVWHKDGSGYKVNVTNLLTQGLENVDSYETSYETYLRDGESIEIHLPVYWTDYSYAATYQEVFSDPQKREQAIACFEEVLFDKDLIDIQKRVVEPIAYTKIHTSEIDKLNNITLRELQSAVYELYAQFGQLDRETDLFSGIELNNSRLLPADDLYPSDYLYPMSDSEHITRAGYEKLWTDAQGVQKFRNLIVTYKAIVDGNEEEVILTRVVNSDGTQDYNMSDNWLFKNLVWTAEQVGAYADAMVEKIRNVSWFPFEMWAAGLPYLETGDELEITTPNGTYTSYILTRQLKGIHNLQDAYTNGTLDIF